MVKSPTASVTVVKQSPPPVQVGSISMIPNGPLTLTIPSTASSVPQHFAGNVFDTNGVGMSGVTLYAFQNGAIILQFPSGTGGAYGFDVTFNAPSPAGAPYVIDVADTPSNT